MTKSNTCGGKKHKKGKKHRDVPVVVKKVQYAEDNQTYALVKNRLGGNRLNVECVDGKIRSAIIPGRLYKKIWLYPNDVLLCDLETTGKEDVCYVILKYNNKEISQLKMEGLINFEIENGEEDVFVEDDSNLPVPQRKIENIQDYPLVNSDSESESD